MTPYDLKKGDCLYIWDDGYKYHVVYNDEEEQIIVLKYYGKRKQWWHYEVKSYNEFNIMNELRSIRMAKS